MSCLSRTKRTWLYHVASGKGAVKSFVKQGSSFAEVPSQRCTSSEPQQVPFCGVWCSEPGGSGRYPFSMTFSKQCHSIPLSVFQIVSSTFQIVSSTFPKGERKERKLLLFVCFFVSVFPHPLPRDSATVTMPWRLDQKS